jgi:hypothetical protein
MTESQNRKVRICPACGMTGMQTLGVFKVIEINGRLFDSDVTDADALAAASQRFKSHVLMHCDGQISHACLEEYAGKEILQPTSPLSKLFASRVRGRRCDHCGFITKLSRLP